MADDKSPPSTAELFSFRLHHIIPISLFEAYGDILSIAGIEQEAKGNKIALFFTDSYLQTVLSNDAVKGAFEAAGFGFLLHRGGHPGYTEFLRDQLLGIRERYAVDGVIGDNVRATVATETKALFAFAKKVSAGGFDGQTIDGSTAEIQAQLDARFDPVLAILTGEAQAPDTTPEQVAEANALIAESQTATFDPDLVDENRTFNTQARLDAQRDLTAELRSIGAVTAEEATKATDRLDIAQGKVDGGDVRGAENDIRAAAIVNGKNATLAANGQLTLTPAERTELAAAELIVDISSDVRNGSIADLPSVDEQVTETRAAQERLSGTFDNPLPDLSQLDEDTVRSLDIAFKAHVAGLGGGFLGDTVEFLNVSYDAFKIAITTGDLGPLGEATKQYGYALVWSAALVAGTIAAASAAAAFFFGAAAAPVAAAIVGAGWAIYGLYDAYRNGAELFGKIADDIWSKIAEAYVLAETDKTNIAVNGLFERIASDTFDAPEGQSFQLQLIADSVAQGFANQIKGSDANELIWARNNAYVFGEGGDDELRYTGSTEELPGGGLIGGAGNDVLLLRGYRDVVADGGEGDDFIIANASGRGGTFVGGLGRDVISVQGAGARIYGDRFDGTVPDGPGGQPAPIDPRDAAHADVIYWAKG
ncbi:MAG: hypothetical protein WBA67_08350, partial [Jannaschia sp.]